MSPLEALVALNALPRIGPIRIQRLIAACGDARSALQAGPARWRSIEGIGPETTAILARWHEHVDPAAEIREAQERGITILTRDDDHYPRPLLKANDPPLLLYCWGRIERRDQHAISIVGSRRSSHYGTQCTRRFSWQLAQAGFTIISGLARGIDTAAHEAAIAAGGRTVAVIGSGLAKLYPPENLSLAEKIADGHGAVVSEFPLHTAPDRQTFPMRNRIVAAWCRALLVTECPAWSGALITANLANEYGKPVFAVPGPIDKPGCAGCNQLIRDGATLVADASHLCDDLGELPLTPARPTTDEPPAALPGLEAAVHAALTRGEASIDQLIDSCGLSAAVVSCCLLKLEMRGLIHTLPGMRFAVKSP